MLFVSYKARSEQNSANCQSLPWWTEQAITLEPKPHKMSDRLCEPATSCAAVGLLVEFEGMEEGPAHTPTTEGEVLLASVIYDDLEEDSLRSLLELRSLLWLRWSPLSSKSPVSPLVLPSWKSAVSSELPPSLTLPPPLPKSVSPLTPPPMVPVNPSVPPLLAPKCCVDVPRIFQSSGLPWKEYYLALPPAIESIAPSRLVDLSALPWLLPPLAPPGTIVLMAVPSLWLLLGQTSLCLWHTLTSSLHLFVSIRLCLPSGFALVFSHTVLRLSPLAP